MPENNLSTSTPAGKLPRGVPFIIGNEAAERFSYYGMLSILTIYLSQVDCSSAMTHAKETVMHLFATAVYFLPLFGAWLADKWLGRYWTILTISLLLLRGPRRARVLSRGAVNGVYLGLDPDRHRCWRHQAVRVSLRGRSVSRRAMRRD